METVESFVQRLLEVRKDRIDWGIPRLKKNIPKKGKWEYELDLNSLLSLYDEDDPESLAMLGKMFTETIVRACADAEKKGWLNDDAISDLDSLMFEFEAAAESEEDEEGDDDNGGGSWGDRSNVERFDSVLAELYEWGDEYRVWLGIPVN